MPLTATDEPGEVDAFGVRFTMEQRGERVRCHVFRSAILELENYTLVDDAGLLAIFRKHRLYLERLASELFDSGRRTPWISPDDLDGYA